jgi:hypothetical protein
MKQNVRTFIHGSLSGVGEQQLVFPLSMLLRKTRKVKFGYSALSISAVSDIAAVACACVTKHRLSRLQRVHAQAAA